MKADLCLRRKPQDKTLLGLRGYIFLTESPPYTLEVLSMKDKGKTSFYDN